MARTEPGSALADWLSAVREDEALGRAIRHHALLAPSAPTYARGFALPDALQPVLRARGIEALYGHQARAITALRAGRDVVLATPTASGKSLVYALPALEASLQDPEERALLLFPLRALEQDQKKKLEADIAEIRLPAGARAPDLRPARRDPRPARLPPLARPPGRRDARRREVRRRAPVPALVARGPHRPDRSLLPR